jgi:hypothetical protein
MAAAFSLHEGYVFPDGPKHITGDADVAPPVPATLSTIGTVSPRRAWSKGALMNKTANVHN